MEHPPGQLLIRTAAVSEMTGIPQATLRYWRREGRGPDCRKIGGRWHYRPSDVHAWVDSHFASTGTEG